MTVKFFLVISSADYTYSYCYLEDLQHEINATAHSDVDSCGQWLTHVRRHFQKGSSDSHRKSFHHYQNVPEVYKYVYGGQPFTNQNKNSYQDQSNIYDLPSSYSQSPGNDDIHSKTSQVSKNIKRQDFIDSM